LILEALPKAAFSLLASSNTLKRLASRYGMRRSGSFARRFIAGESVATSDEATVATRGYLDSVAAIEHAGIGRNISLKLTQLGLDVDRATCIDNLRRVLETSAKSGFFVRVDMENSEYTDLTLEVLETVWNIGYRNVGTVIQSCLKRSTGDIDRLNALGVRVRLVKGAYSEPHEVAYQQKAEVDNAFVELMRVLLRAGTYPAIATHDPAMIEATTTFAEQQQISKDKFEFQMLYGIRRDLQAELSRAGHPFRVYVPFGKEWFPYFMRRLGERPANVGFVVKSLLREK
jgi:proline dehydrogenase